MASPLRTVLGILLALPALVLLLTGYVIPVGWTVRESFQGGAGNYGDALDAGLGGAFGRGLLLALVPLLVVLVLGPVLAWLADSGGTYGRWAARGLLALPLAAYAPAAAAAGHVAAAAGDPGARPGTLTVYWLTGFGLAAVLSVTLYLAALRRRSRGALLVAGGIAALAVVAVALQAFTVPLVAGDRRPDQDLVPATLLYQQAFFYQRLGAAAAVCVLLTLVLMALGVAATLLLLRSRARLEFDDEIPPGGAFAPGPPSMLPFAAAAAGLALVVLVVAWFGLGPWLGRITQDWHYGAQEGDVGANTWLPPLVSAAVGVTVAALAAAGISGVRPLGRHSEWLLLPFGLFLFVGVAPLVVHGFDAAREADRLGTFAGMIPPSGVAIPALFILALLVRGQVERREAALARGRAVSWRRTVAPAVPMVLLVYLGTWLVSAQDALWPLVAGSRHYTGQVAMLQALGARSRGPGLPFSDVLPLWALILLVLVAIGAQLLYLDRVALRAGREVPPAQ